MTDHSPKIDIHYFEPEIKFSDVLVIVTHPTIGTISSICGNYLIEHLNLRLIGTFLSPELSPTTIIRNGTPEPPIRIYAGEYIEDDSTIFDLQKLINSINDDTSLVVISNPFSPIGEYKTIEEIRELCKVCASKDIILLIDEAYVDFSPGTLLPLIEEYDNVVISRTFSKAFGAAGIRVGYLLGSQRLINIVTKVQLTYPLSNVSVKFASYLLSNWDEVDSYSKRTVLGRENLCEILSGGGYDVINSHTNSIHFHESNGDNSETVNIMNSYGLAFKSGDTKTGTPVMIPGDDRQTWIRLSVGPDIDKMKFLGDIL